MLDNRPVSEWLPITWAEVEARGWKELDVVLISGDAYVDHPAFGTAVIGRILESEGLRVAIVPQPNWQDDLRDFKKMGRPRLFFGVTSGCMDSMVNHYTAARRRRSTMLTLRAELPASGLIMLLWSTPGRSNSSILMCLC